ncbi:protein-methionine-sulfoxide reductase heme-binding subunit MsrQ [Psychromarinibacter halotolerans]|uniref:Protein-methionine-sulfoxide reductase heme-binding subunit MsrQ n=1 Tax=Psychromarinibacter halotolerans TaxID=1775175 RepID=A0ABV7GP06_9RHOB|nr:protein-methionine-sulfoxide reductase heme-binding subunit MsrQ [Psychromarinibacter halotolerans]MDF0596071.1 protein-methionine-sulfoxide reductase heme-binding subunit MsrQ [Psychromarinibacter halotolerans]
MTLPDRINAAVRAVPSWVLYALAPLPAAWWFYLGFTGGLGVEPISALEHKVGLFALQLLIAGLAVTPLRRFAGVNLIRHRRAIGVVAFFYVLLHLLIWLVLDMSLLWSQIAADLVKRWYIIVGMASFVLLIPLAVTSNNWSVRKLGSTWRTLHKLVYGACLLGGLHFVILSKGFQLEPMVYMAIIVGLLGLRLVPKRRPMMARA